MGRWDKTKISMCGNFFFKKPKKKRKKKKRERERERERNEGFAI